MFRLRKWTSRSAVIRNQLVLAALFITAVQVTTTAYASLPDPFSGINDSEYLRFHGRGDVLRTAVPFNPCIAFPSGATTDPGSDLHARLRVRLAPESEYAKLDQTNGGTHAPGRVLWTQSIVDQANYAGFTIAYRHDTDELYFVVGDGGGSATRTRMWRVPVVLDDGAFRTIDWTYNDMAGKAGCWIDGVQYTPISVTKNGGAIDPAPGLLGTWSAGGSIMGNARSDAMYTLAGRGWANDIGARNVVWPAPNGSGSMDGDILDENTSILGDLAYAAFRWANAAVDISTSPWIMELELNGGPVLVDSAGGLDSQGLISAEHDSILPFWADTNAGQDITGWMIGDLPDSEDTQTRQLMFYHHGLGNQTITVTEDNGSGQPLNQSLVCCIGPSGDVEYWAIKSKVGDADPQQYTQYTLLGQGPTAGVHTFELPQGEPGLYRVIVRSTKNEGYSFATDQESLYWGAYAPFSLLTGVDQLSDNDAYAYIPQDSDVYDLYLGDITNATQESFMGGDNTLATNGGLVNGSVVYGGSGVNFAVSPGIIKMHLGPNWEVGSRRFPLVLSNSRYAAEFYIRAGVTETANFTHWSPDDKVLRDRILEIASPGLGDANTIAKDFGPQEAHILKNQRRYFSLATYPYGIKIIHTALENQITSTSSAMVGSIDHDPLDSNVILRYGDEPNSVYNFDQFGPALLFWAGWDDTDANPYYGDVDFKNRARCAALAFARHVQGTRIRANETDVGLHPGNAGLAGADDFGMVLHWGRVYNLFDAADRAAILPAAVIELCHILNVNPTSTRNQDAHFLPFLYEVGKLWEQQNQDLAFPEMLSTITEEYAHQIVGRPSPWNGADVAMQEATAFDGSYSGMQNHMIAMGWLASGPEFDPSLFDPLFTSSMNREWDFLRDVLDRQYGFWAHYMGPPLDGTQTAFGHDSDSRTTMGAVREQYNGAKQTGSMASPMAARLLLEDGSDLAAKLIDGNTVIPTNFFPLTLGTVPSTSWTNISNGRGGWRFDLMPLYAGGVEHLFDPTTNEPIDTGAVLPCEVPVVLSDSITIEEIDEGFIAINTPSYYAIVSTRDPGEFYYKGAFAKYQEPRDIEKASNANGGGAITNINNYPNGDPHASGEEIGGVGLSFFYDKTGGGPVISGRNWTPLTTHQLIGYTSNGNRRWADQHSRVFAPVNKTYSIDALIQADLTIDYDLNFDTAGSSSTSYHVQRVLHFHPHSIVVDVEVSLPVIGTEPLVALYENIPFELSESVIGQSERAQRLFGLENLTQPWVGGSIWDSWIGNSWTNNDGLSFTGQEIGWLQKEIPIPTSSPSTLSYTIGVVTPPLQSLHSDTHGSKKSVSYVDAIAFLRAVELGDPAADLDGDGEISENDFALMFGSEE